MQETAPDASSAETAHRTWTASETGKINDGLACLVMVARFHGLAADPAQLAHEFQERGQPFGLVEIPLAAKKLGLQVCRPSRCTPVCPG